ncbi:Laccase-7 [Camellia lanceoleosa]|uniref:Laccase-7 n=1 Tax=Camellia lanceoleosa TaxID=1840588 RepID=A0ACC0HIZ7_9ERIC|nr:Laccase-7 [Camellia lanceoleosa]
MISLLSCCKLESQGYQCMLLLYATELMQVVAATGCSFELAAMVGEWWNTNIIDVENQMIESGGPPLNSSAAFTINGQPGDLYQCSSNSTYKVNVARGKTYLLRIINAAMNNQFFFKIANHKMTVVAIDATYTTPMVTDVIVIAPGQTIDALLTADQPAASYYMAAHTYVSSEDVPDTTTSTTGIIVYENAMSSTPQMPVLPAFNDTPTAYKFYSSLTALVNAPHWVPVPLNVDEHMFVTVSLGLIPCEAGSNCTGPLQQRLAASLNNASFEFNTVVDDGSLC